MRRNKENRASCHCRCACGFCGQRAEGFVGIRVIKQRTTMSQDTKRADPQAHTSVQHSNFSLGSSVQHSTLLLANSSYMNKGTSGPLVKRMPPLKWNSTPGRLQERRRKIHQCVVRGEITNIATLMPFVGMVRL